MMPMPPPTLMLQSNATASTMIVTPRRRSMKRVIPRWYLDEDEDGFGDPDAFVDNCNPGEGYVANADDCDDLYSNVYPGADEYCDGLVNECDVEVDENAVDPLTWFEVTDNDGYGVATQTVEACAQPLGYAAVDGDCAPDDATVSPTAAELCDGIANVCGGTLPAEELDDDGDGYVECSTAATSWAGAANVLGGSDCDDANATISPGATELCDGIANVWAARSPQMSSMMMGMARSSAATTPVTGSAQPACPVAMTATMQTALCSAGRQPCATDNTMTATTLATTQQPHPLTRSTMTGMARSSALAGLGLLASAAATATMVTTASSAAPELCDGKFNDCDDTSFSYVDPPADEGDVDGDGQVECSDGSETPVSSAVTVMMQMTRYSVAPLSSVTGCSTTAVTPITAQ